ncbi:MAG: DUF6063 family protein [Bacillota bacterium]|nr:DUF6063 family protein [Bacillota bacterium]
MLTDTEELDIAIEIIKELLSGSDVGEESNSHLYNSYRNNNKVYDYVNLLTEKFNVILCPYNNQLFVTIGSNNKVWGYTNEEIRKQMTGVNNVEQQNMVYFIIMTLITLFYPESNADTSISFLPIPKITTAVDEKINALIGLGDLDVISEELSYNFKQVAGFWNAKPFSGNEDLSAPPTARVSDKNALVSTACNFLADHKLLIAQSGTNLYYITDRFKAIIYNFFKNGNNNEEVEREIMEFVYDLGVEY